MKRSRPLKTKRAMTRTERVWPYRTDHFFTVWYFMAGLSFFSYASIKLPLVSGFQNTKGKYTVKRAVFLRLGLVGEPLLLSSRESTMSEVFFLKSGKKKPKIPRKMSDRHENTKKSP